jgi:hypothetical protein
MTNHTAHSCNYYRLHRDFYRDLNDLFVARQENVWHSYSKNDHWIEDIASRSESPDFQKVLRFRPMYTIFQALPVGNNFLPRKLGSSRDPLRWKNLSKTLTNLAHAA